MDWPCVPVWAWFTGPGWWTGVGLMYWPFGPFCPDLLPPWATCPYVLALQASLVIMYRPCEPVWSLLTGPSGQFCPDLLALRASFCLMYWLFRPVLGTVPKNWSKPVFSYMEMPETGDVLFLEQQKTASHQIRISRPSFTITWTFTLTWSVWIRLAELSDGLIIQQVKSPIGDFFQKF